MNNQLQNAIKDVKKGLKRFDLFELILKRFVSRRTVKVWTFDVMEFICYLLGIFKKSKSWS